MKNIKLLLYAFSFLLILSSCDDDDSDTAPPTLVGVWKLTDINIHINEVTTYTNPDTPTKTENIVQTFISSENIFTFTDNEYTIVGSTIVNSVNTTEIDGETTVTESEQTSNPPPVANGTWTLIGNQLDFTPEGTEAGATDNTGTISEFTENSHKLSSSFGETIDTDDFTIVFTIEVIETFERI